MFVHSKYYNNPYNLPSFNLLRLYASLDMPVQSLDRPNKIPRLVVHGEYLTTDGEHVDEIWRRV
jgi:hypothetical protein